MSFLSDLFGGGSYKEAQKPLEHYYGEAQGYQQPFLKQLMHPEQLQSQWAKSYETSPQAKQQLQNVREQGLGAASSMGLMGSSAALQGIEGKAGEVMQQDRQRYLDDLMKKYLAGSQVAGQMGNRAMQMGPQMSKLVYGQHAAPGQTLGQLGGAAAGIAGSALGGPIGGALASGLASHMGLSNPSQYKTGGGFG